MHCSRLVALCRAYAMLKVEIRFQRVIAAKAWDLNCHPATRYKQCFHPISGRATLGCLRSFVDEEGLAYLLFQSKSLKSERVTKFWPRQSGEMSRRCLFFKLLEIVLKDFLGKVLSTKKAEERTSGGKRRKKASVENKNLQRSFLPTNGTENYTARI